MPGSVPRTYLVAGTREPFFLQNAARWADALRDASTAAFTARGAVDVTRAGHSHWPRRYA
jgi:hypothetical protein